MGKNNLSQKVSKAELESIQKERAIANLEKQEAEMLNRIKNTQNLQLKVFNKLEEAMYQQQFSVKKRMAQSPEAIAIRKEREEIDLDRRGVFNIDTKSGSEERSDRGSTAYATKSNQLNQGTQGGQGIPIKKRPNN